MQEVQEVGSGHWSFDCRFSLRVPLRPGEIDPDYAAAAVREREATVGDTLPPCSILGGQNMRTAGLVAVVLLAAACSKNSSPTAPATDANFPTDPEKMDERCEQIGNSRQADVSSEVWAWFKKECFCIDKRIGCGRFLSKRYDAREAPFKARTPRALTPEEKETAQPLLAALDKKGDDMTEWTWYRDPVAAKQVLGKYVRFYFGQKRGGTSIGPLRLKVQYEGSDWVFAKRLTIKVDETLMDLRSDYSEWKHENSGGTVWESLDIPISYEHPEIAKALANAKAIKIRFNGDDKQADFVVPQKQIDGLKRVYAAWEASAGVKL